MPAAHQQLACPQRSLSISILSQQGPSRELIRDEHIGIMAQQSSADAAKLGFSPRQQYAVLLAAQILELDAYRTVIQLSIADLTIFIKESRTYIANGCPLDTVLLLRIRVAQPEEQRIRSDSTHTE